MAKMTKAQIADRLEKIALMVTRLDADLKAQFGEEASVFFEADGGIHAMDVDDTADKRANVSSRQKHIIASCKTYSRHGVGAW
ncbi:hypothetical protein [Paraburkholderia sp. C35]|uniref:hypothetical protein n=1 Tax=Paraburkholderia sp. C35 TaxID=2126993 RepID=UPI000D689F83|nr:hypothetical protein [Paraburkholderia sp. C35]